MDPLKLYMAPMKGFTDHMFRRAFTDHFGGFDLAVAPFIVSKKGHRVRRKYVKDVLPENNDCLPVVPQILSKTAKDFTTLANYLYDMGYGTVNWNLGCPSAMVAGKKRGSGMLPYTDKIEAFLEETIPSLKGILSIKIRLGWQSRQEIFRLLPLLNRYPLEEVIIHPRTGAQGYEGDVDLEAFEKCRSIIECPVVYNGDIRTDEDFRKLSQRFDGLGRWMIGRGFLANPFLPLIIKSGRDDIKDKILIMKRFHGALFDAYSHALHGPSHVLKKMKGLWRYFSLPFEPFKKTLKQIKKTTRPEQYLDRVNQFFETEAKLALPNITDEQAPSA